MSLKKKYSRGIFLFHRDLRVDDNTGLLDLLKTCDKVYTCFIFTPDQIGSGNKYRSANAIQFMIESVSSLAADLRRRGGELIVLQGPTFSTIKRLIDELDAEVVAYNRDYSPYAMQRDKELRQKIKNADVVESTDYYLYEPGTVLSGNHAYKKFTPFYESVLGRDIPSPRNCSASLQSRLARSSVKSLSLDEALRKFVGRLLNRDILVRGGREDAIKRFHHALKTQSNYDQDRDEFSYETTCLSAYIKFGCVSIREVYAGFLKKYGLHSGLLRELIWREFFAHVLYAYPEVLKGSFVERYRHLKWRNSESDFEKWKTGTTGFPIVDACMRQMNATGYMHNRGRMVVATFLTKTLLLDWRRGEQYFAQTLTDYDPASNNGNWQSIASTGVDGKPYFRDMNPWIQSAKFDRDAEFIKKWVPELREVKAADIHRWHKIDHSGKIYDKPMVDYDEQKVKMLDLYK